MFGIMAIMSYASLDVMTNFAQCHIAELVHPAPLPDTLFNDSFDLCAAYWK